MTNAHHKLPQPKVSLYGAVLCLTKTANCTLSMSLMFVLYITMAIRQLQNAIKALITNFFQIPKCGFEL